MRIEGKNYSLTAEICLHSHLSAYEDSLADLNALLE